jgi:hypothetical protein
LRLGGGRFLEVIGLVVVHPDQRMDVGVDETRKDRGRTEIDNFGAGWDDFDTADGDNAIAIDDHRNAVTNLIAPAVDQMAGNDRDGPRFGRHDRAGDEQQQGDSVDHDTVRLHQIHRAPLARLGPAQSW